MQANPEKKMVDHTAEEDRAICQLQSDDQPDSRVPVKVGRQKKPSLVPKEMLDKASEAKDYDGMRDSIDDLVKARKGVLESAEERKMLETAFVGSIEQRREAKAHMTEQPAVVVTMTQEIEKICQDGIRLIDEKLMPAARKAVGAHPDFCDPATEWVVQYLRLSGDLFSQAAQAVPAPSRIGMSKAATSPTTRKDYWLQAEQRYTEAEQFCKDHLKPEADQTLTLALHHAKHLKAQGKTDAAIAMLRRALINVHVDSTPAADAVKDALSEFERAN